MNASYVLYGTKSKEGGYGIISSSDSTEEMKEYVKSLNEKLENKSPIVLQYQNVKSSQGTVAISMSKEEELAKEVRDTNYTFALFCDRKMLLETAGYSYIDVIFGYLEYLYPIDEQIKKICEIGDKGKQFPVHKTSLSEGKSDTYKRYVYFLVQQLIAANSDHFLIKLPNNNFESNALIFMKNLFMLLPPAVAVETSFSISQVDRKECVVSVVPSEEGKIELLDFTENLDEDWKNCLDFLWGMKDHDRLSYLSALFKENNYPVRDTIYLNKIGFGNSLIVNYVSEKKIIDSLVEFNAFVDLYHDSCLFESKEYYNRICDYLDCSLGESLFNELSNKYLANKDGCKEEIRFFCNPQKQDYIFATFLDKVFEKFSNEIRLKTEDIEEKEKELEKLKKELTGEQQNSKDKDDQIEALIKKRDELDDKNKSLETDKSNLISGITEIYKKFCSGGDDCKKISRIPLWAKVVAPCLCLFVMFATVIAISFLTINLYLSKDIVELDDQYLLVGSNANVSDFIPEIDLEGINNWKSSDESVLTVQKDGLITALKTGEATITGSDSTAGEVKVQFNIDSLIKICIGETYTIPNYAPDGSIIYTSNAADVVSIENGEIKGLKAGIADISSNQSACYTVVVDGNLDIAVGESKLLEFNYLPRDKKDFTYESGDLNIATVSEAGEITGMKTGTVSVVVKSKSNPNLALSFSVNVTS